LKVAESIELLRQVVVVVGADRHKSGLARLV
jgi:hypothetical protein